MASRHNHVVFEVQVGILGRDLGFAYKYQMHTSLFGEAGCLNIYIIKDPCVLDSRSSPMCSNFKHILEVNLTMK
jgi:hypothetical protein